MYAAALGMKDYMEMNSEASAASDGGVTCEEGVSDSKLRSDPLTDESKSSRLFDQIVEIVANMLGGRI